MAGEYSNPGIDYEFEGKPLTECGIAAVADFDLEKDVRLKAYKALGFLQHRGKDSAGIATTGENGMWLVRDLGRARHVFDGGKHLDYLPAKANLALAHVRYGTCLIEGFDALPKKEQQELLRAAAQPMIGYSEDRKVDIAVAFNGDVPNYQERVAAQPEVLAGVISDGDIIKRLILAEINKGSDPIMAVQDTAKNLEGSAFSIAVLINDKQRAQESLVAVRDPNGFRPLVLGSFGEQSGWIIASEGTAIRKNGGVVERDMAPGEMIVIDKNGLVAKSVFPPEAINESFCAMEEIYLMRPESEIKGDPVEGMRFRSGQLLARKYGVPPGATMVVPVPDSGLSAAYGYAAESGLPVRQGLVRNREIDDRSFITADGNNGDSHANDRQGVVFEKLIASQSVVKGQEIVLVDDSVVRGNTMKRIVDDLRDAGVTKIHLFVASPEIISECHYGMDIRTKGELVAHGRSTEEVVAELGVDSLMHLKLPDLKAAIGAAAVSRCFGCMTGEYPTKLRKLSVERAA